MIAFLVLSKETRCVEYKVSQNNGDDKYFVNQKSNDQSVAWCLGEIYDETNLINGHISSIHDNDVSKEIIKNIEKAFKTLFIKCKGYYIGKKALENRDLYRFITMSIKE